MNLIVKSIAKPIYYKAQDNALGKKSICLAFTYRKLLRKFNNNKEAGIFLAKTLTKYISLILKLTREDKLGFAPECRNKNS